MVYCIQNGITLTETDFYMRLKHYSLAEQVYNELLKQIIGGSRKEGEKLSEETICKELGVSRTPAREALLMLARWHPMTLWQKLWWSSEPGQLP